MTQSTPKAAENAAALATFDAFLTLFENVQLVLKDRMQDDAEKGLGPLHLRALCLCAANPGSTQQQLVQAMGRDKGQIARLTRELEERHYLVRTPDERDRRAWRLVVTPEGEEKSQWFSGIENKLATDMFIGIDVQKLEQLEQLLKNLREKICLGTENE